MAPRVALPTEIAPSSTLLSLPAKESDRNKVCRGERGTKDGGSGLRHKRAPDPAERRPNTNADNDAHFSSVLWLFMQERARISANQWEGAWRSPMTQVHNLRSGEPGARVDFSRPDVTQRSENALKMVRAGQSSSRSLANLIRFWLIVKT